MSGLLSMRAPLAKVPFADPDFGEMNLRLESLLNDLPIVASIHEACSNFRLHPTEMAFLKARLESVKFQLPIDIRMESHSDPQEALKLRCEGVFSGIWDAIVKFFDWIGEKISSIFGGDSDSESESSDTEVKAKTDEAVQTVKDAVKETGNNGPFTKATGIDGIYNMSSDKTAQEGMAAHEETLKALIAMAPGLISVMDKSIKAKNAKDASKSLGNLMTEMRGKTPANLKQKYTDKVAFFVNYKRTDVFEVVEGKFKVTQDKSEEKADEPKLQTSGVVSIVMGAEGVLKQTAALRKLMKATVLPKMKSYRNDVKALSSSEDGKKKELAEAVRDSVALMQAYLGVCTSMVSSGKIVGKYCLTPLSTFGIKADKDKK